VRFLVLDQRRGARIGELEHGGFTLDLGCDVEEVRELKPISIGSDAYSISSSSVALPESGLVTDNSRRRR